MNNIKTAHSRTNTSNRLAAGRKVVNQLTVGESKDSELYLVGIFMTCELLSDDLDVAISSIVLCKKHEDADVRELAGLVYKELTF